MRGGSSFPSRTEMAEKSVAERPVDGAVVLVDELHDAMGGRFKVGDDCRRRPAGGDAGRVAEDDGHDGHLVLRRLKDRSVATNDELLQPGGRYDACERAPDARGRTLLPPAAVQRGPDAGTSESN